MKRTTDKEEKTEGLAAKAQKNISKTVKIKKLRPKLCQTCCW